MEPMCYIGLDVHKQEISYCVKNRSGALYPEGSLPATRTTLPSIADRCNWFRALVSVAEIGEPTKS
jgi:hypothetical protein